MSSDFTNRPFSKLKQELKKAAVAATPPPLPSLPAAITDEDLFSDAMSDVREIEGFRVLPCSNSSRRTAPSRQKEDPEREALRLLEQIAGGELPINLSATQEYIEWTNPESRQDLTEDLHTGRFAVQGMVDLHGLTGAKVHEALESFLAAAFRKGWRCVKIIHGRGLRSVNGPVLKDAVVRRLAGHYRKQVIAFVSARQCDGGLGAMYVLLKS